MCVCVCVCVIFWLTPRTLPVTLTSNDGVVANNVYMGWATVNNTGGG